MSELILPDGIKIQTDADATYADIIKTHLPKQFHRTLAVDVDGNKFDLSHRADVSGKIKILTFEDDGGKSIFWHSSAHVLAQALKRLYPDVKFDDGPAIFIGPGHFYYDVYIEDKKIIEEDFPAIEAEIEKVVTENHPLSRRQISRKEAIEYFQKQSQRFKVAILEKLPDDAVISLYRQGEFEDLCRGPHVAST